MSSRGWVRVRSVAKRALERVLSVVPHSLHRSQGRALVLAYHNVIPDGLSPAGDRSLHLPIGLFRAHLDVLEHCCAVISLADLLGGRRSPDRPVIAITFDDAYRGTVELAVPELQRRHLPCTIFVAPALLGSRSFWWDAYADGTLGLSDSVRRHVLDKAAGRPSYPRDDVSRDSREEDLPTSYGCATEEELRAAASLGHVTLGSHSWSHPNLARLQPQEVVEELARAQRWLSSMPLPTIPVLAYPYGLSAPAVEQAAASAGYSCALLASGGWLRSGLSPWHLPRYTVPAGLSEDGLRLRLGGLLPTRP